MEMGPVDAGGHGLVLGEMVNPHSAAGRKLEMSRIGTLSYPLNKMITGCTYVDPQSVDSLRSLD